MNKKLLKAEPSATQVRIYIEDTDSMGIVYHANYLFFLDRARTEFLRKTGISLTMMVKHDTHFAVHDVMIKYLAPAYLDDLLTIQTNCEIASAATVVFKQTIFNEQNKLLCEAKIKLVCVNQLLKPKRWPKVLEEEKLSG
jgi:acyl-CoA thioester hydrolase